MRGGEDRVSSAPTAATLPPSSASQARPFSRSPAERIRASSSELNMSENSVATVVPRRLPHKISTFHVAYPIAILLPEGAQVGVNQQSLEWDQFSIALEELPTIPNPSTAACRQDPSSMQSMGTQTSPKGPFTPSRPAPHDASTSPINFLPGAPSTGGTSCPPSRTSVMEFINEAALRLQAFAVCSHLPRC